MTQSLAQPAADPRFTQLDGLRGLAALNVLLGHFVIGFYRAWLSGAPAQSHNNWDTVLSTTPALLLYNPDLGVDIFFVLSGFVLALYAHQAAAPLLAMLARRWVRLCVPIIVTTIFAYIAVHAGACRAAQQAGAITGGGWLIYLYDPTTYWIPLSSCIQDIFLTFLTGHGGAVTNIIPPLWTMPIELIGSFALFAAYKSAAFCRLRPWARLAAALAITAFACHSRYGCFCLGAALFELWRILPARPISTAGFAIFALGVWLAATPFVLAGTHEYILLKAYQLGLPIGIIGMTQAGAFLLVAAALICPPFQSFLRLGICQYLGRISFMLYLVHLPVECSAGAYMFLHAPGSYNERAALAFLTTSAAAILIADLAFRLIDQPATRLSRLFTAPALDVKTAILAVIGR